MNNFSWSVDMSAQISGIVREESPNNYKHVVMTMIGSVAELGFHSVSNWDPQSVQNIYVDSLLSPEKRLWMRHDHRVGIAGWSGFRKQKYSVVFSSHISVKCFLFLIFIRKMCEKTSKSGLISKTNPVIRPHSQPFLDLIATPRLYLHRSVK